MDVIRFIKMQLKGSAWSVPGRQIGLRITEEYKLLNWEINKTNLVIIYWAHKLIIWASWHRNVLTGSPNFSKMCILPSHFFYQIWSTVKKNYRHARGTRKNVNISMVNMHTMTMFAVSVAAKIGFQHITCNAAMFTSNSELAIHDCKHISTCLPQRILSVVMEDLCTMTTWHELR